MRFGGPKNRIHEPLWREIRSSFVLPTWVISYVNNSTATGCIQSLVVETKSFLHEMKSNNLLRTEPCLFTSKFAVIVKWCSKYFFFSLHNNKPTTHKLHACIHVIMHTWISTCPFRVSASRSVCMQGRQVSDSPCTHICEYLVWK